MTTLSRSHTEHFVFCVKIATPKSVVFGSLTPAAARRTSVRRLVPCNFKRYTVLALAWNGPEIAFHCLGRRNACTRRSKRLPLSHSEKEIARYLARIFWNVMGSSRNGRRGIILSQSVQKENRQSNKGKFGAPADQRCCAVCPMTPRNVFPHPDFWWVDFRVSKFLQKILSYYFNKI